MGIESDQLVFDYLSRVGDLAQQRKLPSAARMRLVTELRGEIDRSRAKDTDDSTTAVRRILDRLGTPDAVVSAAGAGAGGAGGGPGAGVPSGPSAGSGTGSGRGSGTVSGRGSGAGSGPGSSAGSGVGPRSSPATDTWAGVPGPRSEAPADRPKGLRRVVPRPRPAEAGTVEDTGADVPSPPHLASAYELGDSATQPDWWRVTGSSFGLGDSVPGFTGGVEIPELLRPPPAERDPVAEAAAPVAPADENAGRRGRWARLRRKGAAKAAAPAAVDAAVVAPVVVRRRPRLAGYTNPLLLLAAVLLVAGAVLGNWFALGLGWLIAYGSRRLTPAESKWAVLVLPGLAVGAGAGWLWGRQDGRWGEPIAQGHMSDAMADTWPWVVRGAAVASALYLVWRSQRRR
ncbi:hypothetical protein AB0912_22880 [Streptomyces sp. NPDC007084]|uniref:hypothetical protein n=1 Tax=Streptomyces sp. NPDC007084 TaxID=3154313 RepID=UPI003454A307